MNVSTAIRRVIPSGPNSTSTAVRGSTIENVGSKRPRSSRYMCVSERRGSPGWMTWSATCGRSSKRKSTLRKATSSSHLVGSSLCEQRSGRCPASRRSHSVPLPFLKTARIGFSNGRRVRETKPTAGMSGGRPRNEPIPSTSASKTPSLSRSTSSTRVSFEKLTKRFSYRVDARSRRRALVLADHALRAERASGSASAASVGAAAAGASARTPARERTAPPPGRGRRPGAFDCGDASVSRDFTGLGAAVV